MARAVVDRDGSVATAAKSVGVAAKRARRDTTIDLMRGGCILSMLVSHVAEETRAFQLTHPLKFVDGAFGFVLFSGLVLGIVHRRLINRTGSIQQSRQKLTKRVGVLYFTHLITLGAALTMRAASGRPSHLPTFTDLGGFWRAMFDILTLKIQPENYDILAMYIFLLAGAIGVFALLKRGQVWIVAVASLALYVASQLVHQGIQRASYAWHIFGAPWNLGAWQALFVLGLVVGWYWETEIKALPATTKKAIVGVGIALTAALVVLAATKPLYDNGLGLGFDKQHGGPVVFALAIGFFLTAYVALNAMHLPERFTAVFEMVGRHSLGCVVCILVGDAFFEMLKFDQSVAKKYAATVVVLVAMLIVSKLADHRPLLKKLRRA
ncbi:MAG: OpgC domain-containing protein [Acidimicrobiia bacterium]